MTPDDAVQLSGQVRNCSLTRYDGEGRTMRLERFNDTAPIDEDETAVVTAHE